MNLEAREKAASDSRASHSQFQEQQCPHGCCHCYAIDQQASAAAVTDAVVASVAAAAAVADTAAVAAAAFEGEDEVVHIVLVVQSNGFGVVKAESGQGTEQHLGFEAETG